MAKRRVEDILYNESFKNKKMRYLPWTLDEILIIIY